MMQVIYVDINSVRAPIPDRVSLYKGRVFTDCVSWYILCLLVVKNKFGFGFTAIEQMKFSEMTLGSSCTYA